MLLRCLGQQAGEHRLAGTAAQEIVSRQGGLRGRVEGSFGRSGRARGVWERVGARRRRVGTSEADSGNAARPPIRYVNHPISRTVLAGIHRAADVAMTTHCVTA
jgi:hypothetical protein